MVPVGLEPTTLALSTRCSNQLSYGTADTRTAAREYGGAEEIRTPDPLRARQVLFQLSYDPIWSRIILFIQFALSKNMRNLVSVTNRDLRPFLGTPRPYPDRPDSP